jgi:hypothetical protein
MKVHTAIVYMNGTNFAAVATSEQLLYEELLHILFGLEDDELNGRFLLNVAEGVVRRFDLPRDAKELVEVYTERPKSPHVVYANAATVREK